MTIANHIDYGFPLIVVDDLYSPADVGSIWEELNFYSYEHKFLPPEVSGGAKRFNHVTKNNKAIWISALYSALHYSNIYCCTRKLHKYWESIVSGCDEKYEWYWESHKTNSESILLSYYENSDYYEPHRDAGALTVLNWFYKEPKKFQGGDLFFMQDIKKRIEVKNNRTVIFPSGIIHAVNEVKMSEENLNKTLGRYCITQFLQNQRTTTDFQDSGNFNVTTA